MPLNNTFIRVELEQSGRYPPFSRQWLDHGSLKHKVILPTLASRVEERLERAGFRIKRTDIAPLPGIASKASIGKVAGIRLAAMFPANDVVYLMR